MKIFFFCKKYILAHKYILVLYIVIILFNTGIGVLSPFIIGNFLDNLVEGASVRVILQFCAIFGGLNVVRILKGYVTAMMNINMQTQMSYELNRDTHRHLQGLTLSYTSRQDSVYLSQRVNQDSNSLIVFCISILQSIITNVIMLVAPLMILLSMNWFIAVLLLSFLVAYIVLYVAFKKPLYKASFALKEAQSKFFSSLHDQLKYIKIIKINSIQNEINHRSDDTFIHLKDTAIHKQKVNYLYSGLDGFTSTIAQIVLFVVGGLQVLSGNFTIGMFTIFASYFNMMLGASRYFFGLGASYQKTLVAYNRIKEIFDRKLESCGEKVINKIGTIELRNVSFSYIAHEENQVRGGTARVVEYFSMEFTKGKLYGIVGPNGTGKSTLINLLIGLYVDEFTGFITYDNTDIRCIDMVAARRNLIGFAEQEPLLINDSIRHNLGFENIVNIGFLDEYAEILDIKDFISKHSLDFVIDEKSSNMSGGEKQKISILKVLCKDSAVMIFDEPTSALDSESTKRFISHLKQIKTDKIIIIITHDEFIKEQCDVLVETNNVNANVSRVPVHM